MKRFVSPFLILAAILAASAPVCGQVYVRLVDVKFGAPLEFWQNDASLPGKGRLLFRYPTRVYVDGKAVDYVRYGQASEDFGEEDEANPFGDELVEELGGGPPPDPEIEADRKNEILGGMGVKAMLVLNVREGTHTIHPGGRRFRVTADGTVEPISPGLSKINDQSLALACRPVDLNLLPGIGEREVGIRVRSGGHLVFAEKVKWKGACVWRLFLPVSEEPYEVDLGKAGRFAFVLTDAGVRLESDARLADGATLSADEFALCIGPAEGAVRIERVPPAQEPELYLFNDRNRRVYVEGERVELSVQAWGGAAEAGRAKLVVECEGERVWEHDVTLTREGAGAFAEILLDTALLRPADYALRAEAGGTLSNPLPLTVSPVMPRTNLRIFSHVKWGDTSRDPRDIDKLGALGFNTLSNGLKEYHGNNGVQPNANAFDSWSGKIPTDPERFREFRKAHFPPELLGLDLPNAAAMQALLANQVQLLAVNFGLILYFNVGEHWADQAEDLYQAAQHLAMELRRFPSFAGLTYCTGDGPTPATLGKVWATAGVASFDVIHQDRLRKLREVFEQQYGKIEVDTSDQDSLYEVTEKDREEFRKHGSAWGFRVGEDIKMTISAAESRALLWSQWVNDLYPQRFRTLRRLLEPMVPEPMMTCGTTWGFGAGGGMYPGTFYRALDFPLNDMHGDYGICNFCYMTGTDIITMGMEERSQRPWVGLDLIRGRSTPNGYKLLLQALSRNPAGVGVLNLSKGDWICAWAADKEKSEDLAHLTDIAARIGTAMSKLDRQDEIAVVSSFRQEVLGGQPFRALWAAHYIASKAGYQSTIITDAFCEMHSGELSRYKALLLYRMTKGLSPWLRSALEAYQKQGGIVIADSTSEVSLRGVVRLPFEVPREKGPSNMNDHLEFEEFFLPFIRRFRQTVAPYVKPFFSIASLQKPHNYEINWTGIRSTDGDLEYLTVFNDAKPNIENGVAAQFQYQPDVAEVRIPKRGVLYDALRRTGVPAAASGDGMRFECDGRLYPGSIYVLAPRPIASLELAFSAQAAPGELVRVRARALDAAGEAFTGRLPVEFTLRDPAGRVRYRVLRTTNQDVQFKIAANDPAGSWALTAVEQVTGLVARGTFAVAGRPPALAIERLEELVYDGHAIAGFLKRRIEIPLYPNQQALLPAAKQLAAGLRQHGVNVSVRIIWPSDTRNYPMQWFYRTIEDRAIRQGILAGELVGWRIEGKNHKGTYMRDNFGNYAFYKHYTGSAPVVYYKDVILLGWHDVPANPLQDVIRKGRMLWRNPSPSFPPPGHGLVAYAWGPFHSGHDAVVLHGRDERGLQRAMDSLLRLAAAEEPPARRFVPVTPRLKPENGRVFVSMGYRPAAAEMKTVKGAERRLVSLLPPVFGRKINSVACMPDGRVCIGQTGTEADGVVVDTAAAKAVRYALPKEIERRTAQALAWSLQPENHGRWLEANVEQLGTDFVTPVDMGIGRFDADGRPVWFYDPFPAFGTYNEVKYPRRCRAWKCSGDGSRVLAAFYDMTPTQDDPQHLNRCDVVMLDAASGRPVYTIAGFFPTRLAVSHDGSRAVLIDLEFHKGRKKANTSDRAGLAVFDSTGKERFFAPLRGPVDRLLIDRNATLAAVSYNDARRSVSIIDLDKQKVAEHSYPRIDVGMAVAPDGSSVVIAYSDGVVHKVGRNGAIIWEARVPVAGLPAISPNDGAISIVSADGSVTRLTAAGEVGRRIDFASAELLRLEPQPDGPARPLDPPMAPPFWEKPPKGMRLKRFDKAPFAQAETIEGERIFSVAVPETKPDETLLLCFEYQLKARDDVLAVSFRSGKRELHYSFGYHLRPRPAAVPLRFEKGRTVSVKFQARRASVSGGRLLLLQPEELSNVAPTPSPKGGGMRQFDQKDNRNVPRVMVPNIFGVIGDPRREQMAFGTKKTDVYALFDNDPYSGTELFGIEYPLNEWQPASWERNLRSAQVVMEFDRPRTLRALGIWEHSGAPPAEAYALECCDTYEVDEMTQELEADWKLACAVRGNTQYYHVHSFEPKKAKVWRLTVLRTSADMQRLAEIELYEEMMENLFDLDAQDETDDAFEFE